MKTITQTITQTETCTLTSKQGKITLIDFEDYEKTKHLVWYTHKNNPYFVTFYKSENNKLRTISLHRFIFNLKRGDGIVIDHINRNIYDNRKCNLRKCTNSENAQNSCKPNLKRKLTSQYKGVSWQKAINKFIAHICFQGKITHIGCYVNEIDAAKAYNKKALELHGDFAYINTF